MAYVAYAGRLMASDKEVPQKASFSCVGSSRKLKRTSQADRVLSERMIW